MKKVIRYLAFWYLSVILFLPITCLIYILTSRTLKFNDFIYLIFSGWFFYIGITYFAIGTFFILLFSLLNNIFKDHILGWSFPRRKKDLGEGRKKQ
jgi:hypothetical protein